MRELTIRQPQPQPQQQQAISGYISNGSTGSARVTFLNGLTRKEFDRRQAAH